jgi:hypothetical protein
MSVLETPCVEGGQKTTTNCAGEAEAHVLTARTKSSASKCFAAPRRRYTAPMPWAVSSIS